MEWRHNPDRTLWLYVEPQPHPEEVEFYGHNKIYGIVALWRPLSRDINRLALWYSMADGVQGGVTKSLPSARRWVEEYWIEKGETNDRSGDVSESGPRPTIPR